jgi:hypothetical protein
VPGGAGVGQRPQREVGQRPIGALARSPEPGVGQRPREANVLKVRIKKQRKNR